MIKSLFSKSRLNNTGQVPSSKKKDIELANVNKANEKQLEFILSESKQIDHIYAVKDKQNYEMEFSQSERSVYVELEIPQKLLLDKDEKLDIYFVVNGEHFRPYLEMADVMTSDARHFDIIPGLHRSAYIYFSKKYKRAMLQIKQMQDIEFEQIVVVNNTITLFFDKREPISGNYELVMERWGHYTELKTNWLPGQVTAYLSEADIAEMAVGFGYSVRMINKNDENIPIRVNVKNMEGIQIAKNSRNVILPFKWGNFSNLKEYTPIDDKSYLFYPSEFSIDSIYLEYRERQVYKKLEFENYSDGWISLNINLQEASYSFKGIHTVYQKDDSTILRGYSEISKIKIVEARPDILNLIAIENNTTTKFMFENEIDIISFSLNKREDGKWYRQEINEKLDSFEINSPIFKYSSIIVEYMDDKSHVQKSISKLKDIYVGDGIKA